MTEVDRQRILTAARDTLLAALPDVWAIYVYGSFARGDEWPNSDVKSPSKITAAQRKRLENLARMPDCLP